MDPIEVAFIVGKMKGGGVEATVLSYLKNIDSRKVHITFIIDQDSTLIPKDTILQYGGAVEIIPPYQHQLQYQKALHSLFRQRHFDIVHAHISTMSAFPLLAAAWAGIPVRIVHAHSTAGKGEWKKNTLKYLLRPFSKVFATHLCACSEFAGQWMFGKAADFFVLPNAIDFCSNDYSFNTKVRMEKREELGLKDSVVVGHVGRFIPQKNHLFLIEIFAQIRKQMPNAKLLLVGSGELMDQVKQRVLDLDLTNAVIFTGQRDDVIKLYQVMDMLLFPSIYEGLGMVPIEAQYAGLPVLVSDIVPHEISRIHGLVRFIPLSAAPTVWAKSAIEAYQTAPQRDNLALRVCDRPDNEIPAEQLEAWYCKKAELLSQQG